MHSESHNYPARKTSFVLDENPASSSSVKIVGCVSIVLKLAIDSIKENKKSLNVFSSASNVQLASKETISRDFHCFLDLP
jgi:hypothetical protein